MAKWVKIVVANILVLVFVVGGAGIIGFYLYERSRYIATDDAKVSANMVTVTALTSGKIVAWTVKPGDKVNPDSALGTEQALSAAGASVTKPAVSSRVAETTPPAPAGGTSGTGQTVPQAGTSPGAGALPKTGTAAPPIPAKVDIKAPIGGTIIQSMVEQGQTITPGQVLAMMADLNRIFIVANIEENRIVDVKPGQSVDITLDAFPGQTFDGSVISVIQATSSTFSLIPSGTTSGSFTKVIQKIPVQISINSEGKQVFPGMSASVKIKK